MNASLKAYRLSREQLLEQMVIELSGDERFVAAWLTGSHARNEADEVSDLDLTLVIAEPYSEILCARPEQVSQRTSEERFAIFSHFGEPALIHENNNNAPEGGTFTFVMYAGSAVMVDWILVPLSMARRPHVSQVLFDRVGVPVSPPPQPGELEQRKKYVAEQWAFFWMMLAITIKYLIRGDRVFVAHWLESLHELAQEIERRLRREPWHYRRGSTTRLQLTRPNEIESIQSLCEKMQRLAPQLECFSGTALTRPWKEIERLLALTEESHASH